MSFTNPNFTNPDIHLMQQSQLMPLIRQLHQESLNNNQNVLDIQSNSYLPRQEQLHNFPQHNFSSNTYRINQNVPLSYVHKQNFQHTTNDWNSQNNNSNFDSFMFSNSNFQNLNIKNITVGNREKIGNKYQQGLSNFQNNIQNNENKIINLDNNDDQTNHILFTPLGKSMPARTFNFKLKPSKNKQHQKQSSFKKTIKTNPNKIKEETFAFELETKLANEGKFTLQIYNELKNNFCSLIKVQQISRICQLYLEQTPYNILHLIFSEITSQLSELLLDPYANYFCLKIFYFLNLKDRIVYLTSIAPSFPQLSTNKISTYPIQCVIEHLDCLTERQIIFTALKQKDYIKLALDSYGTHVLSKMLILFDYTLIQPLSLFILDNFLFLANNSNGLCIIKKEILIEYKKDNFEQLQKELVHNALVLVQSPYGNYALQIAIDNWELRDIECIIDEFIGKCSVLSTQKYSSNVIEKSIEKSGRFAEEFVKEMKHTEGTFSLLLKNSYGNYVIQAALKVVSVKHRLIIVQLIEKNLNQITDKKLASKWRNIVSIYGGKTLNV